MSSGHFNPLSTLNQRSCWAAGGWDQGLFTCSRKTREMGEASFPSPHLTALMTHLTEGSKSSTEISQWQPLSSKQSSPAMLESVAWEREDYCEAETQIRCFHIRLTKSTVYICHYEVCDFYHLSYLGYIGIDNNREKKIYCFHVYNTDRIIVCKYSSLIYWVNNIA